MMFETEGALILALGTGLIGVFLGTLLGRMENTKGLRAQLKAYEEQMKNDKAWYNTNMARVKREFAMVEQPPDLMKLAAGLDLNNLTPEVIETFAAQLENSPSVPKMLRPFVRGFVDKLKENPEIATQMLGQLAHASGQKKEDQIDGGSNYL